MNLPTKLCIPRTTNAVMRSRLFEALDSARDAPATWIGAAAGAGKTTLVTSYLVERKVASVWYRVDEGDDDIAAFFYYLSMVGAAAAPRRKALPALTPDYRAGVTSFATGFFTELFSRLKTPFVLVFDNYERVPPESELHDIVCLCLEQLPEGGRAIVVSRQPPPQAFARMRANSQLVVLDDSMLRMTQKEGRDLARARFGKKLRATAVDAVRERSDGWVAGFLLLAELESAGLDSTDTNPELLFDYFVTQVLEAAEPETREFLLRTSFLVDVEVNAARELTGRDDAARLLADLARRNHFTTKAGNDTYAYHPLFRQFLQERARSSLSADVLETVWSTTATWLAEQGEFEEASALYNEMGDWAKATDLIHAHAENLIAQGRHHGLRSCIEAIPEAVREQEPWLRYWLAASILPFDPVSARPLFRSAYETFTAANDPAGTYLAWAGCTFSVIMEFGDCHGLDEWIDKLETIRKAHPEFPSPAIEGQVALAAFVALMYRRPRRTDVAPYEERLLELVDASNDVNEQLAIGYFLILYYTWWLGALPKADRLMKRLRSRAKKPDVEHNTQIRWYLIDAIVAWFSASHDECAQWVRSGLNAAQRIGAHAFDFLLRSQGVYSALSAGDVEEAQAYLAELEQQAHDADRVDAAQYHYLLAVHAARIGELPRALEHCRTAVQMADELGFPFARLIAGQGLVHILAEHGDLDPARNELDDLRTLARDFGSDHAEYWCALGAAHIAVCDGAREDEVEAVRAAFAVAAAQGLASAPWWDPDLMGRLAQTALAEGIETDWVRSFIRQRKLSVDDSAAAPDDWPWEIRIETLGGFRVLIDDEPLTFPRKTPRATLDLLKALIAFGGREVPEERLTEALWPQADGDAAHGSFTTTLHRLRKLLGADTVILRDGRLSLDDRRCWVDTWAVEQLAAVKPAEARAATERMLQLYEGPFLPGHDTHWSLSFRERLHRRFFRALLEHARHCQNQDDEDMRQHAITLYERALDVDPLAEECYLALMECHRDAGRRAEALAVYERCRDTLQRELGVDPSDEARTLAQALRS